MTPEDRLRQEDPVAHRAFVRIRTMLSKRAEWRPEYAIGLSSLAPALSAYLRDARAFRAVENPDPALRLELEQSLERTREIARDVLVQFRVADPELSKFALLNSAGEDALIAALGAPLDSV